MRAGGGIGEGEVEIDKAGNELTLEHSYFYFFLILNWGPSVDVDIRS